MHRLAVLLLSAATLAVAADKDKIEIETREIFAFPPGGTIEIAGSFGGLSVEGWDQPDIEISVQKRTRKEYTPAERAKAAEELERVAVTPVKESDTRFVIRTEFPSRNLLTRPLRGKTNLELSYKIKAPRNSHLLIKHDVGEVSIRNVAGDIHATASIGQMSLRLPAEYDYRVDARCRIGEVGSSLDGSSDRQLLLGEKFERDPGSQTHQLYLRMGIGEIKIRKMKAAAPKLDRVTSD